MKFQVCFRALAIAMSAAWLTNCAQITSMRDGNSASVWGQKEIRVAGLAHKAIVQKYAVLDNPELQGYVNEVGQHLARNTPHPDFKWHFTLLDSPDVNAFSLPGGYVYLTRGILAYLNSEAELAAVLAHEIGHVIAGPDIRHPGNARETDLGSVLAAVANNTGGTNQVQSMMQRWTDGYGFEQELEADRLGARYIVQAGYPAQALLEARRTLKKHEVFDRMLAKQEGREPRHYHASFDTAPGNDARLGQVVNDADKYRSAPARADRNAYLQKLEGLFFGDSSDQGVIRNNTLLHEKLGLGIDFPQGWRVQKQAGRIVAFSPQNDALVEFRPGPKNSRSMETLQKTLRLDADTRFVRGNISGYPASFAAGTVQERPVLVGAVVLNGAQYLIAGLSRDVTAYTLHRNTLKAAINSFHTLSPEERLVARPHRIHLLTANPGTNLTQLAADSPLGIHAASQLRLLNGLYPDGEVRTGQRLKVIQ